MIDSTRIAEPNWGWGTEGQIWACRLSHVLGLVAVLVLIWFVGH
jgi:hypothetical protein